MISLLLIAASCLQNLPVPNGESTEAAATTSAADSATPISSDGTGDAPAIIEQAQFAQPMPPVPLSAQMSPSQRSRRPNWRDAFARQEPGNRSPSPEPRRQRQRGLSPVYNFGDNQDASCSSITGAGNDPTVLEHPNLGCFRLNISENNSAIPTDRVYFRYSHLQNASDYDGTGIGGLISESFEIERFVYAAEKTFFDGRMSVEVRLPFAYELTSQLEVGIVDGQSRFNPDSAYDLILKRMATISKFVLIEQETWLVSGGLGIDLPTAPDFRYRDRSDSVVPNPIPAPSVPFININYEAITVIKEETYRLSPFLAAYWTPRPEWFFQGFMQFEIPLNDADVHRTIQIYPSPGQAPLYQKDDFKSYEQALMRMNVSAGRWLLHRDDDRPLTGWAMSSELHYTTTIEDAVLSTVPFQLTNYEDFNIRYRGNVGNIANRVDILNLVLGNTFEFRKLTTVGTGFVLPLRQGADKPFDFEFILQLNRRF